MNSSYVRNHVSPGIECPEALCALSRIYLLLHTYMFYPYVFSHRFICLICFCTIFPCACEYRLFVRGCFCYRSYARSNVIRLNSLVLYNLQWYVVVCLLLANFYWSNWSMNGCHISYPFQLFLDFSGIKWSAGD